MKLRVIEANIILKDFSTVKDELAEQITDEAFSHIRAEIDGVVALLQKQSKEYSTTELDNVADWIVMMPDDLAFVTLRDLALIEDVCKRMFLHRVDIFAIMKRVNKRANRTVL